MMKLRYHIEYGLFKAIYGLVRLLPFSFLDVFFRVLADLFHALGLRRHVVSTNLRVALGGTATDREVRTATRSCYREHGRLIAEILGEERIVGNPGEYAGIVGLEHLRAGVEKGKGVIIFTGHLGNYVLGGYLIARAGYPLAYVSKPVFNPAMRVELEKIYTRYGNSIIPIRSMQNDSSGGMKIFRHLKGGGIVVVLNDQDAGPDGYRSVFFGRETSIPAGPSRFAVRTGAVALTAFTTRVDGKPFVEIQPPIDLSGAKTQEEAGRAVLDEYSRRLEAKVREAPELYFWFHRKWKSNPEVRAMYDGVRR
ncbi:MAG: lysophospholipid acyltransferase family protein [Deltaproteobacteria bacterium]|nr:lysophospholipid acyltransferase family protein [Deltaproteobacteria bacterium]